METGYEIIYLGNGEIDFKKLLMKLRRNNGMYV